MSTHLGSCRLLPFVSHGDGAGGFWLVVVRVRLWAVVGWCLDVVRGLVGCGIATFGPCFLSKKKGAGEGSDGAHLDVVRSSSSHACPRHRMVVILSPSLAHMVVPLPSCVSVRWVGTNMGWGYSPWHPKLHNDDERRMSLVVRHLVSDVAPGCRVRKVSGGGK